MIYPSNLCPGDGIAIISPATVVKPEYIDGAAAFFEAAGYRPVVMPHAKGPACGSFASDYASRLGDLEEAFCRPDIKAILCARGGYGCSGLLSRIDPNLVRNNPKWLIGFSDISALHAYLVRHGVASIHGPMAKHITEEGPEDPATRTLMQILTAGPEIEYQLEPHPYDIAGTAEGILVGGNLAVLNDLVATPYDIFDVSEPMILFIEDISEAIYAVERTLIRLLMSPQWENVRGLIVGSFTEYRHPDANHEDMYSMIQSLLADRGVRIPVKYGFPTGHTADNLPLVEGTHATLHVTTNTPSTLRTTDAK